MSINPMAPSLATEITRFREAETAGDVAAAWAALERAHILSQPQLARHLRVHWLMLGYAVRVGDVQEVWGQLLRLVLAPLGALTGRIPRGNTGRSNVSAFKTMPMPRDIEETLARTLKDRNRAS